MHPTGGIDNKSATELEPAKASQEEDTKEASSRRVDETGVKQMTQVPEEEPIQSDQFPSLVPSVSFSFCLDGILRSMPSDLIRRKFRVYRA